MATAPRPKPTTAANRATRRAAPKKAAAPRKAAPKKPVEAVEEEIEEPKRLSPEALSLADLDEESSDWEVTEPLPYELKTGEVISLGHPADVEYSILASRDPDAIFSNSMSEEDWEKFVEEGLSGRQVSALFMLWAKHHGLGTAGE